MADLAPHNMTSNTAPTPFVASASAEYSGSYAAYEAFDGATGETARWLNAGSLPAWLKLDLGTGNEGVVGSYDVKGGNSGRENQSPKNWTLQGSNDDSAWDTLDTVTNQTGWTALEVRSFNCDVVNTAYRYFRINITAASDAGNYVTVSELNLNEAPAATTYTLTGPSGGTNGVASRNFTVTPNGIFTGTITPNDNSDGGTFTPTSLTWTESGLAKTFTYTPASTGAKTIAATNDGGLSNPSSLTFYSVGSAYAIQPTDLWENGYSDDQTDYFMSSPFARLVVSTNATGFALTVWTTLYASFPAKAKVAYLVNGVATVLTCTATGSNTFYVDGLAAGTKTIELVAGTQMQGTPRTGTFLKSVQWYGTSTSITSPSTARRMTLYGDSIITGWGCTNPPTEAVGLLVRARLNGSLFHESWASRALYDDSDTSPIAVKAALITQLTLGSPTRIWLAIGVNDYGHSHWTCENFGTAYADLVDRLHTALPNARIFCQTPVTQGTETANGLGDILDDYRAQITTICGSRSWTNLIDGKAILTYPGDYADDQHPNTSGNVVYATALGPYAVVPTGLTATAASSSVIDLAWTDNASAETSYRVEWTADVNWATHTDISGLAVNSQSYQKTGLDASTTYYFRAIAVESSGDSINSNVASDTTAASSFKSWYKSRGVLLGGAA